MKYLLASCKIKHLKRWRKEIARLTSRDDEKKKWQTSRKMAMIGRSDKNRGFILFLVFFGWGLIIAGNLIKIQVFNYAHYVSRIEMQSRQPLPIFPKRGTIYDSRGEKLADSDKVKSAFINNKDKQESLRVFNIIDKKIVLSRSQRENIRNRINRSDKIIWIKRQLTDSELKTLDQMKSNLGDDSIVDFLDEYKRIYPAGTLASHILGGVAPDESGLYGIEKSLNSNLGGKGAGVNVFWDARQKIYNKEYLRLEKPGEDIQLTIESVTQLWVENELKKSVEKHQARGGTVIIMDCRDGAILAMASYPFFYPQNPPPASNDNITKNKATSFLFEPGSAFNIVLASSALENHICVPEQEFFCYNGKLRIRDIDIVDPAPFKKLTFEEIIIKPSGVGAVRIGLRLGKKKYYSTIESFGFGAATGIELPGEESGKLIPLKQWDAGFTVYSSQGYEIEVTPLQMARAFNIIASGGYLVRPYILKRTNDIPTIIERTAGVLSSSTCKEVTAIMINEVKHRLGMKTKAAGKAGIGRKSREGKYVSTFGGFFPAENPAFTIFVLLEEPKDTPKTEGGKANENEDANMNTDTNAAAGLFKAIIERLAIKQETVPGIGD